MRGAARAALCAARWHGAVWRAFETLNARGELLRYATYQALIGEAFQVTTLVYVPRPALALCLSRCSTTARWGGSWQVLCKGCIHANACQSWPLSQVYALPKAKYQMSN